MICFDIFFNKYLTYICSWFTVPGPAHDTVDDDQPAAVDGLVDELCGPVEVPEQQQDCHHHHHHHRHLHYHRHHHHHAISISIIIVISIIMVISFIIVISIITLISIVSIISIIIIIITDLEMLALGRSSTWKP